MIAHPFRRAALTAMLTAVASLATAADVNLPLEAQVKLLAPTAPAAPSLRMPMPRQPSAAPTTPGGKLPQYQMGHHQRTLPTADELQNPRWRFILGLPKAPLVVEATITIDGLPFQMARERRIDQLLQDAAQSPDEVAVPASPETPAKDEPAASPAEPRPAQTVPPYSLPASAAERLRRYVQATGQPATRDEVRWLLTNWVDGPTMLLLNDNFQRFRSHQRPAFVILDRDRDGSISAAEAQQAVQSLQECDLNRDEIIQFTEIAKAAADPRRHTEPAGPGQLITRIPDASSAAATYHRLASQYAMSPDVARPVLPRLDHNHNGEFDAEELRALAEAPPDLRLSITFDSAHPEASRFAVTQVATEFADAVRHANVNASAITMNLGGTLVSFLAVQMESADQISIGAVNDGYPLLPELDPNDDGRLTIRELRELVPRLLSFDSNRDGSLTADEVQSPIRVCIGLGPGVHRELAGIRSLNSQAMTPPLAGPEWFVRMDRNKDNDLTRGEFPGTDEQFAVLDADADKLISAAEAVSYDRDKSKPSSEATPKKSSDTQ